MMFKKRRIACGAMLEGKGPFRYSHVTGRANNPRLNGPEEWAEEQARQRRAELIHNPPAGLRDDSW